MAIIQMKSKAYRTSLLGNIVLGGVNQCRKRRFSSLSKILRDGYNVNGLIVMTHFVIGSVY